MIVSVDVVIGMFVDPLLGFGVEIVGGLFIGTLWVEKVYHFLVQLLPSVAFTYQRYVVEYARPEIAQVFVPLCTPCIEILPMFGLVWIE